MPEDGSKETGKIESQFPFDVFMLGFGAGIIFSIVILAFSIGR